MNNPQIGAPWLVVTDLDGTLLDHDSYCFQAAMPSMDRLDQHNIPIIINSSKTHAEINQLRQQLDNHHPFIIENGSAIITPTQYFDHQQTEPSSYYSQHYERIILGMPRAQILDSVADIYQQFAQQFNSYSQSSIDDIVAMTGLTTEQAQQSAERYYTEPVQWLGTEADKKRFLSALHARAIHTLQGGRFIHLMGDTDKGRALIALKEKFQGYYQNSINTIALGDSHNDIAMLQAADIAVVIRSPHYAPPEFEHPHKIISQHYGPKGWHECIQKIIFNQ